ncbi:MAG: type II toxin-antitoxin system HicA family toxin [Chitinophagaceae bacterium]|nr:type II toxin-antitoxin system HicA family toxin [Chitinophagaceae bacterium]
MLNRKYQYEVTRQTGSHIRISTTLSGQHHVTIPNHNPIRLGTLSSIIHDIADHFNKTKEQVVEELF